MHREGGGRNQPAAKAGAGDSAFSVEECHLRTNQSQPPTAEKKIAIAKGEDRQLFKEAMPGRSGNHFTRVETGEM